MASRFSNWFSRVAELGKLFAVALALAGQISSGVLGVPRVTLGTPFEAAMVVCLGGSHPGKDGLPPIHRHLPGAAIAALGHHFIQHSAIVERGQALPPPPASLDFWTGVPEARGPPARYAAACYPTGPPPHLI
jgi:hypothetical protein